MFPCDHSEHGWRPHAGIGAPTIGTPMPAWGLQLLAPPCRHGLQLFLRLTISNYLREGGPEEEVGSEPFPTVQTRGVVRGFDSVHRCVEIVDIVAGTSEQTVPSLSTLFTPENLLS